MILAQTHLTASEVVAIYSHRWQIESIFHNL
ncbi:transposase, partial [Acidithiobacillus sp. MC6.1]|nr:transposase [Acidithiobacillus sp. MC6.1]